MLILASNLPGHAGWIAERLRLMRDRWELIVEGHYSLDSHNTIEWISRSAGLGRTRLFHPWGREPEGDCQAPMFPCRTLSDTLRGQGLMG